MTCPICGADPHAPRCPSLMAVFEREERELLERLERLREKPAPREVKPRRR